MHLAASVAVAALRFRGRTSARRRVAVAAHSGRPEGEDAKQPGRRGVALCAPVLASASVAAAKPAPASAGDVAADDPAIFVGKYTDPNHYGGYREITLLDTYKGELREARVEGGGGRNEPQFFVLPATVGFVKLDKAIYGGTGEPRFVITIDFTPKGGPANFHGVWDKDGITFLGDNNHWPKGEPVKKKKKTGKFTFKAYSV